MYYNTGLQGLYTLVMTFHSIYTNAVTIVNLNNYLQM